MITKKIAICGAPFAGKQDLLKYISVLYNCSAYYKYHDNTKNICLWYCQVNISDNIQYLFCLAPSHIFYKETLTFVLENADAVIYIFNALKKDNIAYSSNDPIHENYFNDYLKNAQSLNKTWQNIPWIILLNKHHIFETEIPSQILLPAELKASAMGIYFDKEGDIDERWTSILKKLP